MSRASRAGLLKKLYKDGSKYSDAGDVTQLQHALQSAKCAQAAGADNLTVVAALLHDVGWKLAGAHPALTGTGVSAELKSAMDSSAAAQLGILSVCPNVTDAVAQHDVIGAWWLRMLGFHEKVPALVEGHVLAKRYLVSKEPTYYDLLNSTSKATLVVQGGPMTPAELSLFEASPLFEACLAMRRWDEASKNPEATTRPWEFYEDLIEEAMTEDPKDVSECVSHFVRDGNTVVQLGQV